MADRESEAAWIRANLRWLFDRSLEFFKAHGRGMLVLESPVTPLAVAIEAPDLAYVVGNFFPIGCAGRTMVRTYQPENEVVIAFFRDGIFYTYQIGAERQIEQGDVFDGDIDDGSSGVADDFTVTLDTIAPSARTLAESFARDVEMHGETLNDVDLSFGMKHSLQLAPTTTITFEPDKVIFRRAKYFDNLRWLLSFFDLGDPAEWRVAYNSWRRAGLPKAGFPSGNYRDVMHVLQAMTNVEEEREKVREQLASTRWNRAPIVLLTQVLKGAGMPVGRPEGTITTIPVRKELLLSLRQDRKLGPFLIQHHISIKRSTYQRIENDGRASRNNALEIAKRLKLNLQEFTFGLLR
jgi:hypothetical protein